MLVRMENRLLRLRRALSRSAWMQRLLGLSVCEGDPTRTGLLMLQIDGLSRRQLERAVGNGEMPFLKRLLEQEEYRLHSHYSGLPASTPAVQAELFYGIRTAVPAFAFKDRSEGRIVRMYEPRAAAAVQARLERESSEPLLAGGSSWSNNFGGGAAEVHYCPSAPGWGRPLRNAGALVLPVLLVINLYSFLRIGVLLLLETLLGLFDFVRGLWRGQNFIKELKFIPTRVAICILLRELCVIGAKIDLHRGLPVVHINLLGYDEQSHRRGPDSRFAHWTLKGIDDAIARLWRAAHRAHWRHYEVWIYSDHGQCHAAQYEQLNGRGIDAAVSEAFGTLRAAAPYSPLVRQDGGSVQTQRVRMLGGRRFQRLFSVFRREDEADEYTPQVTALGPVGFVYSPWRLSRADYGLVARQLTQRHQVPVVITHTADGLRACTRDREYRLPEQCGELFGHDHPFLDELRQDLPALCRHENSGELVLLGWHAGVPPQTFATESGTHAGPTPDETHGFCLLPGDTPLPAGRTDYLRPARLREAALAYLGRADLDPRHNAAPRRHSGAGSRRLRIMTYNVHSCIGMDGKLNAERVARVIARHHPDVVALQEVDVGRSRTGGEDQAHAIARYLRMDYHFHPAMHIEEEKYGDAILTHLPMRVIRSAALPGLGHESKAEPRGALWVEVDLDGTPVHIINTHLGLSIRERKLQAEALLGPHWLGDARCDKPVILCGDFNALPSSRACRLLRGRLNDAQTSLPRHRPKRTFYSRVPTARIDHIFIDPAIEVRAIEVPRSQLTLKASDHLPLLAEVIIPAGRDKESEA